VLKTLDILIGVATVMLLFSMVVTIVTQSIISAFQTRGRNLRDGLAGLLKQLDPGLEEKLAAKISTALLRHPLIGGEFGALGTVIHRDEFTTLLMEVGAGQSGAHVTDEAKAAVVKLLQKNGVSDPAAALKNIRDVALQIEAANPQLANSVRYGMAVLQEAKSDYVAKVHGWFDQTIDRVSQRFTANAHGITFVVALIVAFSVQLDTIGLINRLSTDDAMRTYLVGQAQAISDQAVKKGVVPQDAGANQSTSQPNTGSAGKPASGSDASPKKADTAAAKTDTSAQKKNPSGGTAAGPPPAQTPSPTPTPTPNPQKEITNVLQNNGLIVPPKLPFEFKMAWPPIEWHLQTNQVLGILISALLLSLGAPFWYGALQSLLKLRSSLAQKDDQQRANRQVGGETQEGATAAPAGDSAALPASLKGEQGNLQAVG
jgi:hypothetical protein